jgi:hypothetical protein
MFDPKIMQLNREQEEMQGVIVSKLRPGTRVIVTTRNSVYEITVIEGSRCWIKGGKHFPEFVEGYFQGSTWGGSCLKLHWIGFDMQMEFIRGNRCVRTTPVESASVHGPDYSYKLYWPQNNEP